MTQRVVPDGLLAAGAAVSALTARPASAAATYLNVGSWQ
jgi:hypothetical protein